MAKYREISRRRFDGFFDYQPGNVIEGIVRAEIVTGVSDNGKERGFIAIELTEKCLALIDDKPFDAEVGQLIAISITSATRVLIGLANKQAQVRCTFNGFSPANDKKKKPFQDWKIELME